MRSPEKQKDRLQIPLMYAFRDAFAKHDSEKQEDVRVDGERVMTDRNSLRRRSAEEGPLKKDLSVDLLSLVDTIDLASCVDIDELDYVKKSILNFGLYDLTHVTLGSDAAELIAGQLKTALLQHEPRLSPDSLVVERVKDEDFVNQRLRFRVKAEMMARPLDIPVEFIAEFDGGAGKVSVARLPGLA